ncbi:MAG: bifunctional diaminohydroxyphosphoribosylaminopyrimidine deaminase/5-amino-6-(5-phosphoribosylamino)uracil reductase RibD [Nitrospirae bacterium]|nr:bifunctional diaminohydroxyphosphoribosylaminopyrimidine deaminase/5-amino-6-(5-phosphoribosylamino)uracil reductase RibD [Nitrospirota bacterium]
MTNTERDNRFMALALRLAARGRGATSPNPMVGAVIVAGNRIVGQGYHRRAGGPHAEILALQSAGSLSRSATLYVTLEPCCHEGKRTPPCVPALIESRLRRIVVAMRDPNPSVSGRGISLLRRAGIRVSVGCLRKEAEQLNEIYCHWMKTGRPYVLLKTAMTLDGKIATATGESRWITGTEARRDAHRLRSRVDAIMVGIGTVLHDDPRLTARLPGYKAVRLSSPQAGAARRRQPLRVVLDSRLRIPDKAKVLSPYGGTGRPIGAMIVTTEKAPTHRIEQLRARGLSLLVLPAKDGRVPLSACLIRLGQLGVSSLLIEGGSDLNAAVLREGLVNRIRFYLAPCLLGGQDARGGIGGRSPMRLSEAIRLTDILVRRLGRDLVIEGQIRSEERIENRE